MDALRPYTESDAAPWDRAAAAHLARRAGFGAAGTELDELVALGPDGAVARFVDFPAGDEHLDEEISALGPGLDLHSVRQGSYGAASVNRLRRWWLYRMVRGRAPLQEKLALFWHDHFACQESKVIRTPLLVRQNELFRRHAAGSFRELVREVARDPAMLVFLDNRLSAKGAPNENWARELLELFTLGVDRYTQTDVTELARVFTGWTTPRPDAAEFRFDPALHDEGDKLVLGKKIRGRSGRGGHAEGGEAIDHLLAQVDCAPFLARKLLGWFATREPAPAVEAELAALLVESDWSIRATLRALFSSAWFHAPERRFCLYKNPVELMVGVARGLDVQNPHLFELPRQALLMGMQLFEPPSVAGWDHGDAWIRTGSVAPRLNFALDVSETAHAGRKITGRAALDLDDIAGPAAASADAALLVEALATRVLQRPLEPAQAESLAAFLQTLGAAPDEEKAARSWRRARTRACLHMVLATPQLALA